MPGARTPGKSAALFFASHYKPTVTHTFNAPVSYVALRLRVAQLLVKLRRVIRQPLMTDYKLGVIVSGALVTEVVFSYPGIGYLILQAINTRDFFLLQGCFLFIILGVLLANFAIDIAYVLVDPRTRTGMQGESA